MRKIGSTIKQAIFGARQKPLSTKKLCKRAYDLLCEVTLIHMKDVGDAFSHMVAVFYLMEAVYTLLDRPMTPEAMRWAYSRTRCALNQLGFTPEREQKMREAEKERVADVKFLQEHKICVPENLYYIEIETEEM